MLYFLFTIKIFLQEGAEEGVQYLLVLRKQYLYMKTVENTKRVKIFSSEYVKWRMDLKLNKGQSNTPMHW